MQCYHHSKLLFYIQAHYNPVCKNKKIAKIITYCSNKIFKHFTSSVLKKKSHSNFPIGLSRTLFNFNSNHFLGNGITRKKIQFKGFFDFESFPGKPTITF
jgi:hypothetical protein